MKIYFPSTNQKLKALAEKAANRTSAECEELTAFKSQPRLLNKRARIVPEPPTV